MDTLFYARAFPFISQAISIAFDTIIILHRQRCWSLLRISTLVFHFSIRAFSSAILCDEWIYMSKRATIITFNNSRHPSIGRCRHHHHRPPRRRWRRPAVRRSAIRSYWLPIYYLTYGKNRYIGNIFGRFASVCISDNDHAPPSPPHIQSTILLLAQCLSIECWMSFYDTNINRVRPSHSHKTIKSTEINRRTLPHRRRRTQLAKRLIQMSIRENTHTWLHTADWRITQNGQMNVIHRIRIN